MTSLRSQEKRGQGKDSDTNNLMGHPIPSVLCRPIFSHRVLMRGSDPLSVPAKHLPKPKLHSPKYRVTELLWKVLLSGSNPLLHSGVYMFSYAAQSLDSGGWSRWRKSTHTGPSPRLHHDLWTTISDFKPVNISLIPLQKRSLSVPVLGKMEAWSQDPQKNGAEMCHVGPAQFHLARPGLCGLPTLIAHCRPGLFTASIMKQGNKDNRGGGAGVPFFLYLLLGASVSSPLGGAATVEVVLRLRFRFCTFCSGWKRMT